MISVLAVAITATSSTERPSEGQHWYDRAGRPVYEVLGANGQMRPATLRDARKLGLLPGVSSILAMEAKPALTRWKVEQALMSAITLPRQPGETDDSFKRRALEDSEAQAAKARDKGVAIHASIQGYFEGRALSEEHEHIPHIEAVTDWIEQRFGAVCEFHSEKSFGHSAGYGGKADILHPRGIVLDVKCKEFGPDKTAKEMAYPEHVMQLAAYADGFGFAKPDCANIFVSTLVPGLIQVREWDDDEIEKGREAFQLLLRLWQIRRDYYPAFSAVEIAA